VGEERSEMRKGSVRTFEFRGGEAQPLGGAESMNMASFSLPQGSYTTFRTYGGCRVLRLGLHLRRLEESVALQGQAGGIRDEEARRALAAALVAEGRAESRVRLTFAPPRLFAAVEEFVATDPQAYAEGVACVTVPVHRKNPRSKDTRFIATASETYRSLPPGNNEGLLVADDGSVLEGLSSNFFAVFSGVLRTERARVLLGVTRTVTLEVAAGVMPIDETAILRGDLPCVSECFVTSVSREVLPVVRIDGQDVGDGRPGPNTSEIMRRFATLVQTEAEPLF
jgi:branched-subunit amino acid aminotransferase/4-amino-4-deoxychorismate lyase